MITLKQIYDIAISHMDEYDPEGSPTNDNTRDYENRTPAIMTALFPELYLYDSRYQAQFDTENRGDPAAAGHAKYRLRPGAKVFKSMEDEVALDDELCFSVAPYGLGAALLADENPPLANFLQARYDEMLEKFAVIGPRVRQPADWEPIQDVYGAASGFDDAHW